MQPCGANRSVCLVTATSLSLATSPPPVIENEAESPLKTASIPWPSNRTVSVWQETLRQLPKAPLEAQWATGSSFGGGPSAGALFNFNARREAEVVGRREG